MKLLIVISLGEFLTHHNQSQNKKYTFIVLQLITLLQLLPSIITTDFYLKIYNSESLFIE